MAVSFVEPDILITDPEDRSPLLAVEVKGDSEKALVRGEATLTSYMLGMRCPLGLLVTPLLLRLFRHTLFDDTLGSVQTVVSCRTPLPLQALMHQGAASAQGMETSVQQWLERLGTTPSVLEQLPDALRKAVETHVLPALRFGRIQALGPRTRAHVA